MRTQTFGFSWFLLGDRGNSSGKAENMRQITVNAKQQVEGTNIYYISANINGTDVSGHALFDNAGCDWIGTYDELVGADEMLAFFNAESTGDIIPYDVYEQSF